MAQIRVPPNVSSVTLTTSGVVAPVNNIITCTAVEATSLSSPYAFPGGTCIAQTVVATGLTQLIMPLVITSITINAVAYAVTAGLTPLTIPAADATAFIAGGRQRDPMFELVSG